MSALLNALLESSQRDYQNNPWIGGGMGLAQQDFSGYNLSPIHTVLMQTLRGLGSGISTGYGEAQVKKKSNDRFNKFASLEGDNLVKAMSEDPDMSQYAAIAKLEEQDRQRGAQDKLNQALASKGFMLDPNDPSKTIQLFDQAQMDARAAGMKKLAELQAERDISGGHALSPKDIANTEIDLSNKIASSRPAIDFNDVASNFDTVKKLMPVKTVASSLGIITALAKIIDPGAVVRENDFSIIANPGSPARMLQSYLDSIKGDGQLTDDMKSELYDLAKAHTQSRFDQYKSFADSVLHTGQALGANPEHFKLRELPSMDWQASQPEQQQVGGAPEGFQPTGRTSGGKQVYQNAQGQLWTAD